MSEVSEGIDKLIDYIGGKDNVESVSHCATRLRFILKDTEKVDTEKVESLKFVNGSFYQGGQFQIIIGNQVAKYYSKAIEQGKIKPLKSGSSNQEKNKNAGWIQKIVDRFNKD